MQITDVTATCIDNESWGEWVEFPLASPLSQFEAFNNADGDNPRPSETGSVQWATCSWR